LFNCLKPKLRIIMKKQFLVLATIATAAITTSIVAISCKRNFDTPAFQARSTQASTWYNLGLPVHTLPNVITSDLTLGDTAVWVLDGKTYVTNGAKLTIDPGTYVAGKRKSTNDSASALIVTRGSQLEAIGDPDFPIVFTSYEACPRSGDWGGIVILGRAALNRADTTIEGINLPSVPAGVDVNYGGGGACSSAFPNDNSGTLSYVRIEYAGAEISPNNELNGLTLGGVGSGTTLDHIEVAWGADDAFEFFGGNVNAKYLVALAADDDALDFDFGYTGSIQFAVSILKPGADANGNPINYSSSANGVESSSAPNCVLSCTNTRPVLSNITVIGFADSTDAQTAPHVLQNAAIFNTASSQIVRNSLFIGFRNGVNFNCSNSIANAPNFQYNTVQAFLSTSVGATINANNRQIRSASANDAAINLLDPADACSPDFRPAAGSTLLTDAVDYTGLPAFITPKTYRGACASGTGADALWPNAGWVVYAYPPFCVGCN
jgi:hypothetical protein